MIPIEAPKPSEWYNFRTGGFDLRHEPVTDDEALDYIPQYAPARNLYRCRRAQGYSILEAMERVLIAALPAEEQPKQGQDVKEEP